MHVSAARQWRRRTGLSQKLQVRHRRVGGVYEGVYVGWVRVNTLFRLSI